MTAGRERNVATEGQRERAAAQREKGGRRKRRRREEGGRDAALLSDWIPWYWPRAWFSARGNAAE